MPTELTGGGGGQGVSALGGAIEAGRIGTFWVLAGVVCHHGKEDRKGGGQGQIYLMVGSTETQSEKKSEYGRKTMTN
jgi:hypothetical protein